MRERIRARLAAFERQPATDQSLRPASVAIVLVAGAGHDSACFLLTRRPRGLSRHSGQYALPGGRADNDETPSQTARRELHEELGVATVEHDVLGLLDDYPTRSGFRVTPVVIWQESPELRLQQEEVAAAFRIPITDLMHDDVPRLHAIAESEREVLSIHFRSLGHEVFAPTAAMLFQFREVALHGRATRVSEYEQPLFAWR